MCMGYQMGHGLTEEPTIFRTICCISVGGYAWYLGQVPNLGRKMSMADKWPPEGTGGHQSAL